jgi:hypothetical protein
MSRFYNLAIMFRHAQGGPAYPLALTNSKIISEATWQVQVHTAGNIWGHQESLEHHAALTSEFICFAFTLPEEKNE